jgi:acyl-CoA synthetase (AMP-forming)/AMP-acid ligase II
MPRFDAKAFIELAAKQRCTLLSGIPTMLAMIAREQELLSTVDLTSVKALSIGSAPLTEALVDRVAKIFPNAELRNSYGTTEGGPAMFGPHPNGLPRPSLALGYPYPNVDLRLVDGSENEGKLLTRTPAVMKGYLNNPTATEITIDPEGWLKTGDIASIDSEGFVSIVDRLKELIKYKGFQVAPAELEAFLLTHPAIADAAVIGIPDIESGEIPRAFVVVRPGQEVSAADITAFMEGHVAKYKVIHDIVFIDEVPKSASGKILRRMLRD